MILFEGNLPQKQQREREKERERESASELDAKWYGNRRKQGTTGWISIIVFARSVNVHNSMCLVYAKLNGLSCMVPGYPFSLYIYSFLCTPLTKNSCNTKVVFKHFDRDSYSYVYIYIYIYIICIYIYIVYTYICIYIMYINIYIHYVCGQNYKGSLTCGFRLVHSDTRATEALSLKALWRRL